VGHVFVCTSRGFAHPVTYRALCASCNPNDYTIGMPIGFGASSVVYSAEYHPSDSKKPMPVALKVVDLERLAPSALRLLTRETQLMSLSKHPNVLRVRGTWVQIHKLYIAVRLMRTGSISDVMRYKFTAGVEEEVARCILKQALQGLK
jgi:serine/threonine-protein kinase OSR1/STK39